MRNSTLFFSTIGFVVLSLFLGLQACTSTAGPKPIKYGKDQCVYCKMTVSDPRFGTQLQTKKGRVYNFDDVQCMIAFVKESQVKKEDVAAFYLPDFVSNELLPAENLYYLHSEGLKSPMRGDIAAFADKEALEKTKEELGGTQLSWNDLWN